VCHAFRIEGSARFLPKPCILYYPAEPFALRSFDRRRHLRAKPSSSNTKAGSTSSSPKLDHHPVMTVTADPPAKITKSKMDDFKPPFLHLPRPRTFFSAPHTRIGMGISNLVGPVVPKLVRLLFLKTPHHRQRHRWQYHCLEIPSALVTESPGGELKKLGYSLVTNSGSRSTKKPGNRPHTRLMDVRVGAAPFHRFPRQRRIAHQPRRQLLKKSARASYRHISTTT